MFGRKKKQQTPQYMRIKGTQGILYDSLLTAIDVPEKLVIELSIEFFDDPEPCQIHRSAVLRRVFMELGEVLGENEEVPANGFSPEVKRYLAAYDGAQSAEIYRPEE